MENIKILVADDDREIAQLVHIYLTNEGYQVLLSYNGKECLEQMDKHPDVKLVILDIMMPVMDGLEACREIRKKSDTPIIFLSAKAEDMDRIEGFQVGADDYLCKPFHPLELMARVKSQLKKYQFQNADGKTEHNQDILVVGDIELNKVAHEVKVAGKPIKLTPIEFSILALLLEKKGQVLSTEEIFSNIWKEKIFEVNNTVMVHIRRLREKIEKDPKHPEYIMTVWGVGYKIEG